VAGALIAATATRAEAATSAAPPILMGMLMHITH
jgi:hypothetical protein